MADLIERDVSVSANKYMLHWLYDGPSQSENLVEIPGEHENDVGLSTRLYRLCLDVLRHVLCRERFKGRPKHNSTALEICLGKLYLWGDEFRIGDLDQALDQSDDLKGCVLEQLVYVGELLIRGKLAMSPC